MPWFNQSLKPHSDLITKNKKGDASFRRKKAQMAQKLSAVWLFGDFPKLS
jgi:hypothetical protein